MNASSTTFAAAALTLCVAPTHALDMRPDEDVREIIVVETTNEGPHAQTVEIKVDGGEIAVRLNGEHIDADRIREEGGRIMILDGQGNEIESLRRVQIGGGNDFTVRIGEGGLEDGVTFPFNNQFRFGPTGPTPPVMLGVTLSTPDAALRKHLRLEAGTTTLVRGVLEGFPAYQAGIEEYDVIVEIEGADSASPAAIREALMEREAGDKVKMTVIHEGQREKVSVLVTAYDAEAMAEAKMLGGEEDFFFGPGKLRQQLQWFGEKGEGAGPNIFIAPDVDGGQVFEFKHEGTFDPKAIQEQVQKHLRESLRHVEEGDVDNRLEEMSDRMIDIEDMLDRLLSELEKSRRDDR